LTGAIAAYASVRLVAGLLLALGPLFALFLLFDATRGLFEGWVRGLAGSAFGAAATSIVLGVELALMEPWMATVIATRRADISTPNVPVELLVLTLVFGLVLVAVLIAAARLAYSFRIPLAVRTVSMQMFDTIRMRGMQPAIAGTAGAAGSAGSDTAGGAAAERTRAVAIAEAVAATQRRELFAPPPPAAQLASASVAAAAGRDGRAPQAAATIPLGQSGRRRTRGRVSSGAQRRDRTR
jgi:type IV secretion system protein VirB6